MQFKKNAIDSHMHVYKWYDDNGKSFIEGFDEIQKATGLKGLCINALTDEKHGGVKINIMAAIYKLHNPTAYAYANLFYPETPLVPPLPKGLDPLTQYKEFMEIGFDGIKILYKPDIQKKVALPINDEFFEDFFATAEKDNTHFIWHVADPKANWDADFPPGPWNYSDGTYPSFDEMFEQTFDVLNNHPNLNADFAHFFFLENEPEKLEEVFSKYKNVCIDVVPGLMFRAFEKKPEYFREFLTHYADRILFGSDSDFPSNPNCEGLITAVYEGLTTDKTIDLWGYKSKGINLPDEITDKILYENFKVKCHPTPNPINQKALKRYIEKYSVYMKDSIEKTEILKFAEEL